MRFRIFKVVGDEPATVGLIVGIAINKGTILVICPLTVEVDKCSELLWSCRHWINDGSTPEFTLSENFEVNAGDDAKIVAASLEGRPEGRVSLRVCNNNLTRCEYNLGM